MRGSRKKRPAGRAWLAAVLALGLGASVGAAAESAPTRIRGELDAAGLRALVTKERGAVLVNFWATWCVPCREEFPDLDRLSKDLSPRGLTVIGVSTDFAGQTAAVEKFLASTGVRFANYRKKNGGDDQTFIEAVDPKWGGELPFSVLYGPGGRKLRTFSGKRSYDEYRREVLRAIDAGGR